jgi:hypothetical protein
MKRTAALWLVLLTGCSTAPIADLLDFFKPGQIGPEQAPPYGGVCGPRLEGPAATGPVLPPAAVVPGTGVPGPVLPPAPGSTLPPPATGSPAPPPADAAPPAGPPAPGLESAPLVPSASRPGGPDKPLSASSPGGPTGPIIIPALPPALAAEPSGPGTSPP